MDVERLLKCGEKMGLHGEDLRIWIDEKMDKEREVKEIERREKREEKEKEREAAAEHIRQQGLLIDRQLELEKLKLENIAASAHSPNRAETGSALGSAVVKSPRLPCFDDATDQIDSYLLRFQRHAKVNRWPERDWAIHLSALLRGKALDVYTRLDEDEANDYDKVKMALLRRYNLTEDGFLEKFRKSRPETGERMNQFKTRLSTYLDKWVELAGKDKTSASDVLDLVMKEQLLNTCSKNLMVFLKERKPGSSEVLVELVEKYVDAHGTAGAFSKGGPGTHVVEKEGAKEPMSVAPLAKQQSKPMIRCHKCQRFGHLKRQCVASIYGNVKCSFCQMSNHRVEDCWTRKRMESVTTRPKTEEQKGSPEVNQRSGTVHHLAALQTNSETQPCIGHTKIDLGCGYPVACVTSAACLGPAGETAGMPVASGWLDGKKVRILRDSGSNFVVVRKGLVKTNHDEHMKKVTVHLADGTAVTAPLTRARLECPYFKGDVSVVEMASPLYDVMLGNIPDAKCPGIAIKGEEHPELVETSKTDVVTPLTDRDAEMVQTRAKEEHPELGGSRKMGEVAPRVAHDAETMQTRVKGGQRSGTFVTSVCGNIKPGVESLKENSSNPISFKESGKVLVLLPTEDNKFMLEWRDEVVETDNHAIQGGNTRGKYQTISMHRYSDTKNAVRANDDISQRTVEGVITDEDDLSGGKLAQTKLKLPPSLVCQHVIKQ